MKRILALDLGSFSAMAGITPLGHCYVQSRKFNEGRESTALTLGRIKMERPELLSCFWAWLVAELRCAKDSPFPYDVVIYERPFARGQSATRMLWGIAGIIEALASAHGATVLDASPSEIKQWSSANGGADKEDMLAAARRLGYAGDNEHEADAFCLLHYAMATLEFDGAENT